MHDWWDQWEYLLVSWFIFALFVLHKQNHVTSWWERSKSADYYSPRPPRCGEKGCLLIQLGWGVDRDIEHSNARGNVDRWRWGVGERRVHRTSCQRLSSTGTVTVRRSLDVCSSDSIYVDIFRLSHYLYIFVVDRLAWPQHEHAPQSASSTTAHVKSNMQNVLLDYHGFCSVVDNASPAPIYLDSEPWGLDSNTQRMSYL